MTEKMKVLIGDDSPEYGLSWASLLKEEGMFAVTRQKNGRILLENAGNGRGGAFKRVEPAFGETSLDDRRIEPQHAAARARGHGRGSGLFHGKAL